MEKITWKFAYQNSDKILADGLWQLIKGSIETYNDITYNGFGNYIITHDKKPYYVGEAKDISKLLKQQFNPKISTFYKNYRKHICKSLLIKPLSITDFKIQHIPTRIGRKEVEEFGIVNLPTILNSFQIGKRAKNEILSHNGIWSEMQKMKYELLKQGEKEVFRTEFCLWFDNKVSPSAGLYIVKNKNDELIYIGESSNINERFTTHTGTTYFSALRRHIGTEILSFELNEKNGRKKYFAQRGLGSNCIFEIL
jgi:predicted GIY-YIG superfamily endonuclease